MANTVSCNTKSLIAGNGIRQQRTDGFLSWFTCDGTRKLVSLYLSARSFPVGYGLQPIKLSLPQYRYGNVNVQELTSIYLAIAS